jgi:hypothetical protein
MSKSRSPASIPDVSEFDQAIRAHVERMSALRFPDAVVLLPFVAHRWPLPEEATLCAGPIHDYAGRLTGFPDGHLVVTLERDDGMAPLCVGFQRIALVEGARCIVALTIKDERVALRFGGTELGPFQPEQEPLEIRGVKI